MPLGHARGTGTTKGKLRRSSIEHAPKYHLTPFSGSQKKTSNNSFRISDWRTNKSSQSKASALLTENQGDRHLQAHQKIQLGGDMGLWSGRCAIGEEERLLCEDALTDLRSDGLTLAGASEICERRSMHLWIAAQLLTRERVKCWKQDRWASTPNIERYPRWYPVEIRWRQRSG
jgi:hypothetical protein